MLHSFSEQQERARRNVLAAQAIEKLTCPAHFLVSLKQRHFKTVNQFFNKYSTQVGMSREIFDVVNFDANTVMQSLVDYSKTFDVSNRHYLEVLKIILSHINKKKNLYPYLLWETHAALDKLHARLCKPSDGDKYTAQEPIRELLTDIFAKLKSMLGENCCEQVAQYHKRKETLRKMR